MSYSAKNIEVLKGLEPVRLRPGMYIGNTGRSGLNHLVQELIDNSVDEHLAGYCKNIYVSINEDGSATVSDDGRGVPVDIHATEGIPAERVVYTVLQQAEKNILPTRSVFTLPMKHRYLPEKNGTKIFLLQK